MKGKNISRFKRDVTVSNLSTSNVKRVKVNPKAKYSRNVRAKAKEVNAMLKALEEEGYEGTWASKILLDRLSGTKGILKGKRVVVSNITKQNTMTQLVKINRDLTNFINSKTSTLKGIKSREKQERDFITEQTGNEEFANELTKEEIQEIYKVFNDENYKIVTESGGFDSDTVFDLMINAKEEDQGVRTFIDRVKDYSTYELDADVRDAFKEIYRKYSESEARRNKRIYDAKRYRNK